MAHITACEDFLRYIEDYQKKKKNRCNREKGNKKPKDENTLWGKFKGGHEEGGGQ